MFCKCDCIDRLVYSIVTYASRCCLVIDCGYIVDNLGAYIDPVVCICVFDVIYFFFQAEDGIRDLVRSRGLGDVYKRQNLTFVINKIIL